MVKENILSTLLRRSIEILKKDGFNGYIIAIKKYYEAYPPLRNTLYYWLYSKLARSKMIVREIQGSKMYLNLDDFGLSKHLFFNDIREPECTKIMKKWLKEGMTIVDIGANIGYYALLEASLIGDKGKVYAIEPFPSNFELLQKNIGVNSYENIVEPYNIAIGNRTGTEKLFASKKHNRCNMLGSEGLDFVEVEIEMLDKFMVDKKLPDIIRMDLEGFEYYVIDGMKKTLRQCKTCKMFIEVHPFQLYEEDLDYKKVLKTLFALGFKPKYIVKEHGPLKEEAFTYDWSIKNFFLFLKEKELTPPENTHGFGLFLEKN